MNMGAWSFINPLLYDLLENKMIKYIGRPSSSSTATGSNKIHQKEQEQIIYNSFQ